MTEGEFFISSLPVPAQFHDANKRRTYEFARLAAIRLIDDPQAVEHGRAFIRRHTLTDPHQEKSARLWLQVLAMPPREIARTILADTPEGAFLRETMPVIHIPDPVERRRSMARARLRATIDEGSASQ